MSSHNPIRKDSSILIVGAGTFGLSTALDLARQGYTNVKVIDRAAVPSPFSAGRDLNKIVRAEYEDPFYTDLALSAIEEWQTPFWAPFFKLAGYVLATSANSPQKARDTLMKSFSSIEHHPSFPAGSFTAIKSPSDVQALAPQLQGPVDGWIGYLNKHAGYARAGKALEHAYRASIDLGMTVESGDDGYASDLIYSSSPIDGQAVCTGVKAVSGKVHSADTIILAMGAHVARLLPSISAQITAKSWAVAHLELSPSEAASLRGIPVINCRDLGFFFEPDADTDLLKLCAHGAGYVNYYSTDGTSLPPSGPGSTAGIPEEDEKLIRQLIKETMPQFSGRELVRKFICWCGDTADSNYIVDFVPGVSNLVVASGDSGHMFKMLPIAGRWVTKLLETGYQSEDRWKWKHEVKGDIKNISWRVGTVKDIKDVRRHI